MQLPYSFLAVAVTHLIEADVIDVMLQMLETHDIYHLTYLSRIISPVYYWKSVL